MDEWRHITPVYSSYETKKHPTSASTCLPTSLRIKVCKKSMQQGYLYGRAVSAASPTPNL